MKRSGRAGWLLMGAALMALGCEEQAEATKDDVHEADGAKADTKKKAGDEAEKKGETKPTAAPETKSLDDAKAFMGEFVKPGADHAALTKKVIPQAGDYEKVFEAELATKAKPHYEKMFSDPNGKIAPKDGQTELLIWSATTEELRAGTGDAGQFPGGYKEGAANLKPGVTWYRFKFVTPGSTIGMAYDGLTYVNGHWALFPKPWRLN